VIVRALPAPPQVPPLAAQDVNVTPAGRVSDTTTDVAVFGPSLCTDRV
jgi:hypothetical protein